MIFLIIPHTHLFGGAAMERVTISMSEAFSDELGTFMETHGYENRSEAIRDLARLGLEAARIESGQAGECLATLVYVFNHHERELAKRLTQAHHGHHDVQIATLHVHLDHENCLEVAVLRGDARDVKAFSEAVIAERGVRHGKVSFIPVRTEMSEHTHDGEGTPHRHEHLHPRA
jgi:CopG family transcriptional regulator, nickel-responsive regulator